MSKTDHKDYIEQQYKLAIGDYRLAHNDDQRHAAMADMARLEGLAATMYGFDYADKLNAMARNDLRI